MIFGRLINRYYFKYWKYYFFGIAVLVFIDYVQLQIPLILLNIVNGLTDKTLSVTGLLAYLKEVLFIVILVVIGRFLWRQLILGGSRKVEFDLRQKLFIHHEELSQDYYSNHKTGAIMAYYTNDLETIRNCFSFGIVMVVDAIVLITIAMVEMLKLNVTLSFVALLPLLIVSIISIRFVFKLEDAWDKRQLAYEKISDFITENFYGINVIKAFVKQKNEYKVFNVLNHENKDTNVSFYKKNSFINAVVNLVIYLVLVLILLIGGYQVLNNDGANVGIIVAFVSFFGTLIWPILSIPEIVVFTSQGKASLKRLTDMMDETVNVKDDEYTLKDIEVVKGDIIFKDLNFSYPDSDVLVLKNINLNIKKGQRVGIIGKTGCGKSTLIELLLRVYNTKPGDLIIGGTDIRQIPLSLLRNSIGYVPQDNFLFSETILNNICFGLEEENFELTENAAKMSSVHTNIIEFKEKYETIVGERGVTLSGGQKQRISIARALIKDPEILILDDSVSAVDTATEVEILANLKNIRENKTTITVAHRITTIIDSDLIVVMNEGEIVSTGTHKELMENSSLYREIFDKQRLDDLIGG